MDRPGRSQSPAGQNYLERLCRIRYNSVKNKSKREGGETVVSRVMRKFNLQTPAE